MSALSVAESQSVSRVAASVGVTREYLSLRLGSEEYGIDILRVQEIRSHEQPTRIAGAPRLHPGRPQPSRGDRFRSSTCACVSASSRISTRRP